MLLLAAILLTAQAPEDVGGSPYLAQLAAEGRFAEAAAEVEKTLAAGTGDRHTPRVAAYLRAHAGDHAHAWRHLETYLARADLGPEERATGEQRRAELLASTREVAVQVDGAAEATVAALRRDDRLPPLDWPVVAGKTTVRLDMHDWELHVTAPGHTPVHRRVGRDEMVQTLRFTLTRAPGLPATTTTKRAPPGALVAGAVVLPIGVAALAGTFAALPGLARTRDAFAARQAAMLGHLTTSADLADLRALRDEAHRREVLVTALGVTAGVGVVVGAVLLARGVRLQRKQRLHLGARPGAAFIGLSGQF